MNFSSKYSPNRVGIRNSSDYSPFGVELDGRTVSVEGYRFGNNGMESDDEVKGTKNSYTSEFRQYDPRIGRWLTIDPKMNEKESPYIGFGNNPMIYKDQIGDTVIFFLDKDGAEGNGQRSGHRCDVQAERHVPGSVVGSTAVCTESEQAGRGASTEAEAAY